MVVARALVSLIPSVAYIMLMLYISYRWDPLIVPPLPYGTIS